MLRLKANKTSLYRLVRDKDPCAGGFRAAEFRKTPRQPSYFLEWGGAGLQCQAYFAASMGAPILTIEKKDFYGKIVSRVVHTLDLADLRERGMVEEFTTVAERRRAEHGAGR